MRVLGIERAGFADDFSFIEVQLRTDQSQGLTLELATDVLQEVFSNCGRCFILIE